MYLLTNSDGMVVIKTDDFSFAVYLSEEKGYGIKQTKKKFKKNGKVIQPIKSIRKPRRNQLELFK